MNFFDYQVESSSRKGFYNFIITKQDPTWRKNFYGKTLFVTKNNFSIRVACCPEVDYCSSIIYLMGSDENKNSYEFQASEEKVAQLIVALHDFKENYSAIRKGKPHRLTKIFN